MEKRLYIVDLVTAEDMWLQFIPDEMDYEPQQGLVTVKINGRNNPIYQYSGSEDTLSFSISWVASEESRQDVMRNCRFLESLTKSNGNIDGLHEVYLGFGDLFDETTYWIITKASYKMSLFNIEKGGLPTLATQDLEFKRVATKNLTHKDIRKWQI